MRSGMLAQGPEVAAFETEFSAIVDGLHSVALNSGTSALHMAFLAAGVGPGDEVIVPSFSFAATANSVALTGATPVFVDIELDDFSLDPAAVEAAITPRTKAIMPVHLYGHPADMVEIKAIADKHGLLLFEDAAQAHAASVDGVPVGAFGGVAVVLVLPDQEHDLGRGRHGHHAVRGARAARCALLRNQGMERRYENEVVGFNTRMTDIHAAIGRVQLTKLAGWTAKRQENAAFLSANLRGRRDSADGAGCRARLPPVHDPRGRPRSRRVRRARLPRAASAAASYYPTPIHRLPSFELDLDLPVTERAATQVLSLPVYPSLTAGRPRDDRRGGQRRREGGRLMTLRAGLLGLGVMGRNHARVLARLDGVEFVGVYDPAPSVPDRVDGKPVVRDLEEFLDMGIDYAVVAAPTVFHLEIGQARSPRRASTRSSRSRSHPRPRTSRTLRDLFAAQGPHRRRRPHRAVQPRSAGGAPADRGRAARRDLPDRDAAPGTVPGPHRRRRA